MIVREFHSNDLWNAFGLYGMRTVFQFEGQKVVIAAVTCNVRDDEPRHNVVFQPIETVEAA